MSTKKDPRHGFAKLWMTVFVCVAATMMIAATQCAEALYAAKVTVQLRDAVAPAGGTEAESRFQEEIDRQRRRASVSCALLIVQGVLLFSIAKLRKHTEHDHVLE